MSLPRLSPREAKALIDKGAVLIDVREPQERARARIAGSTSLPLSQLPVGAVPKDTGIVIYHCKSGMRTGANAPALADKAACEAYILDGGLDAWAAAGLPLAIDRKAPIEIMRQVQITAGALVVAGVALGAFIAPSWYGLAAAIGAGLMFSGISGTCAMAKVLSAMPWNRVAA